MRTVLLLVVMNPLSVVAIVSADESKALPRVPNTATVMGNLLDVPPSKWLPIKTDLFQAGKDGYATHRIPGIVVTKRGVVLAYCAARKDGIGDWADIDIALRRSLDGGKSWQPPKILVDAGKATADNPTAIVDHQTGAIHFLYQVNYARCFYMRSDDDGRTFSTPVDITAASQQFRKDYDWNVIAPGPGHGIQLASGRLLVPVWLSTGGRQHRPSCVATIYSDDHGRTWHRGEIVVRNSATVPNPSESVAVQILDGRVMLNIRNESRRFCRLISFSPDGATRWTKPVFDEALFEPVCMASMIRVAERPGEKVGRILFANPDSRSKPAGKDWCRSREALSIKVSEDEGHTWPVSRVLEPGISGYSDLAVLPDGTVLCFYERGGAGANMFHTQYLTVARFPVEWAGPSSPTEPRGGAR
jgi:sialidase-1